MLKKLLVSLLALNLCSCGFQVIYKEDDKKADISYTNEMAAIRIKKDRIRVSQELKNNLYDILNPDQLKAEPKYFLTLRVTEIITPTFITITGSSGRNKLTLNAIYELKNLTNAEILATGAATAYDNYDISSNRYASYTAENYLRSNLTKILSQSIRDSLVNDFIELKKKCDKAKEERNQEFSCPLF